MRRILSLILILFCVQSLAQMVSKVNFNHVKEEIQDSTSKFYYPKLMQRFREKDTTFTHQEYHMMYYGSVFQDYYYPYGSRNNKKDFLDAYKAQNYEEGVKKGKLALDENPVDLEVLLKMSICHLKLGNNELKRYYALQYYNFLDVIYYSGDGQSLESAFVVTSVDHEYYIAGDLGLRVVHQQLINDCDLLSFSKKDQKRIKGRKKIKELYFNVRMPLMSLSKSFKDADLPDPDDE